MTLELDDQAMIRRLQTDLESATYDRATSTFAARSRTPILSGIAGVAAAVAAVTVFAWPGSSSPTLAWSPRPTAATTADEVAASAACGADLYVGSELQRDGGALSAELPPLVALDLRGTGGLATFSDDNLTLTCLLIRDGDGFERGPIIGEESSTTPNTGTAVVAAASTEWKDGKTIAMLTGVAPDGAAMVEVSIPGQPTATAVVNNGRFAIWWFGTVENLSGSVSSFDADNVELGRTDLDIPKGDGARG